MSWQAALPFVDIKMKEDEVFPLHCTTFGSSHCATFSLLDICGKYLLQVVPLSTSACETCICGKWMVELWESSTIHMITVKLIIIINYHGVKISQLKAMTDNLPCSTISISNVP